MDISASPADENLVSVGDRIAATAATIDTKMHALLCDIRRFDAERGWAAQGMRTCAHWLSWRCGLDLHAAREQVRVARALSRLPLLDDALRCGQLSYSKVRAVTRIAKAENDGDLVQVARSTPSAKLERLCRRMRQAERVGGDADVPSRWLRVRDLGDGMVRLEIQLRAEEGERVVKAASAGGLSRADGILAMAELALRGERPDRPPVEVVVHVDASSLRGETGGAGIPAETTKRLLCDANIVPVVEDDRGVILQVGRRFPTLSEALRRELFHRDGGCRFPGCTHKRFLHGHPLRHWIDGGELQLPKTVLLCGEHHVLVHEGGFQIDVCGGGLRFLTRAGEVVPTNGLAGPGVVQSTNTADSKGLTDEQLAPHDELDRPPGSDDRRWITLPPGRARWFREMLN